jgi:hypothetical protein
MSVLGLKNVILTVLGRHGWELCDCGPIAGQCF